MSNRPTSRPRSGSRLRTRLVVQLMLVTGLACGLMAWASYERVRTTFEKTLRSDLERRVEASWETVESLRLKAESSSGDLVDLLLNDDPVGLRRLLSGGAEAAGESSRLMPQVGLEWLEILDGQGTVLSSAAWPEQAGLRQLELLQLPEGTTLLLDVATASKVVPAFGVRRELRVGDRALHLVCGILLDAAVFSRMDGGGTWLEVLSVEGELTTVGRPAVSSQVGWEERAASWHARATDDDGRDWLLGRRAIDSGGSGEAWLVTAASWEAVARNLRTIQRALAMFAALTAILAGIAGVWIARRVTVPVADLVRSVDAIAAGTQDYTFTRSTENEFEDLTTSFSRLHRSLELQRERSRAAERVAAWRDVARRVAHEVKNPLMPIRLTVENLVRARSRPGPLFDEMFDEGAATILEEVDRLKRLVGEFSEFARLPLPTPLSEDLVKLVDDAAALFRSEPGIALNVHHEGTMPAVRLDADQISRALTNVVGNAVDALRSLPDGRLRQVTIRTAQDEDLARIDVDDSGPGLSPEALNQLFEPYFTTKVGGTGLGLSITYRIITEHGGVITAQNRDEGGVRITLRLPL